MNDIRGKEVPPSSNITAEGFVRFRIRSGMSVQRRGQGRPIVFVHGWCLNSALWSYTEAEFSTSYQTIAVDLPGFGHSDSLDGPYTLDRYADEVGGLLIELDCSDAIIVGFAFGACVAMTLAARQHPALRGTVLLGVPSAEHVGFDRMPRAMRRDWPLFAQRSASTICQTPISKESLDWLAQMFLNTSLAVALETAQVIASFEPLELAAQIDVPTLFIHGLEDQVTPAHVTVQCAEQMAAAGVQVIPDCGHLVVIDAREDFHASLAHFMQDPAEAIAKFAVSGNR